MALNFFSAFLGALGVCLFAANLWLFLSSLAPKAGQKSDRFWTLASIFIGSLCFAFSKSYWSVSLAAKGGIYSFQVVLELAFLLYFQHWVQNKKGLSGFYFLVFIFSVGLVNHWPTQMLLVPALALVIFAYSRSSASKAFRNFGWKQSLTGLTLMILVLSLYLYLPLRARLNPALNFGNPSSFKNFWAALFRAQYFKTETLASFMPTALSTIQDKGVYISDRFGNEFAIAFSLISLLGVFVLWRQNRRNELLFLLVVLLTALAANLLYLQVIPIEYWHMDDHLLTVNWVIASLGGLGVFFLLTLRDVPNALRYVLTGALLLLPLQTFLWNLSVNDQTREFLFKGYGMEALKSMDRSAAYFAESDYDYFSMIYLQQVEHKRPDVDLKLTTFLTQSDWENLARRFSGNPRAGGGPLYCAFPNGPFVNGYLQYAGTAYFKPAGTVVEFMATPASQKEGSTLQPLEELWNRYLIPEPMTPNPIDGLLQELCAHPYLNTANYLRFRGDLRYWDSYYLRALSLIQDSRWLAETWANKAGGDIKLKKSQIAAADYLLSAMEYRREGMMNDALESIKKAAALDPSNPAIQQAVSSFNQP